MGLKAVALVKRLEHPAHVICAWSAVVVLATRDVKGCSNEPL